MSYSNGKCNDTRLVRRYIGSAYDNVKTVAENIEEVKKVASSIDSIGSIGLYRGIYEEGKEITSFDEYYVYVNKYGIAYTVFARPEVTLPYKFIEAIPYYDSGLSVSTTDTSEGVSKGSWGTDPLLSHPNEYVIYDGVYGSKKFKAITLPYQVNSTSHPNPNSLLPDPSTGYAGELVDVSKFATKDWVESGEAKITAEGSTESRSMKERFADSINVKDFGAVGDGVTDDTDAITAALNSQHDVIVFTEGTYILRSKDPLKPICHVTTSKSLTLIGEGAVLKIADDSLEYQFMIGSDDPSLVVPYFEMHGFRFDCNKSMLTYTIEDKALKYFNGGVKFRAAKEVYIHNNVVDDAVSRQFFFFPSVTSSGGSDSYLMDRAIVRNNTFNRVGRSDLPYYDSSLIYLNGLYGDASNNFGSGESMGVEGAVSFIEMHCATNRVSGNFCDNFMNFCIMTGITINTTIDSIVSNNVCDVYRAGIIILAGQYLDHISGLGIDGLVVVGNHVRIKQSALTSRYTFNVIGIGGGNSANLDIKNVKVQNNTVEFEKESTDLGYTSYIHGIGFPETNDATVYESIVISGNTIINAPHAGVVMGVGGGVFQNTHIGTNFITNAAQSLWPGSGSSLKSGVYVGAHELKEYFLIDKQQITDTFNTSRLKYGVNFNVSVDSKTCNVTAKANLSLSGVDSTEFSQVFRATNSNVLPYVSGQCNQDFSYGSQPLKKGSSIVHTGTGLTHELPEDGIIFLQVGWGTAAPLVGKFNQGSRIMNTSPNVDGNGNTLLGWVCIGVGSPGTWSPMIVSSTSS